MANWQSKLDIRDVWNQAQDNEISVQELAGTMADRLVDIKPCKDEELIDERDEIIDELRCLAEEETASKDEFDYIMASLYDWADTPLDNEFAGKKACWIWT